MLTHQVEKLLNERDAKEQELIELLKLSPQDIWNTDLDNFMAEWEVGLPSEVESMPS
jgi:DNA topoisomerase-2